MSGTRSSVVLVGDIGGTHTRVGLARGGRLALVEKWKTAETTSLEETVARYAELHGLGEVGAAAFAVAGPLEAGGRKARLTNADWSADTDALSVPTVLLNDLQAAAWCRGHLSPDQVEVLAMAPVEPDCPAVFVGLGTGLGTAVSLGDRVLAGEGGHAGFAPSTAALDELVAWLRPQLPGGQVIVEHVLGGAGLGRLLHFAVTRVEPTVEVASGLQDADQLPEGLVLLHWRSCPACALAMELYLEALGAELAGLGLRLLARGGVYLVGGIAHRLGDALSDGRLVAAMRRGPDMVEQVQALPLIRVLHDDPVLLGAAYAADHILVQA